jgi:dihydrofolate synthase/folylpolyglutamate synthase
MTYAEAIQFLYGLNLFGANFGLENTFRLAARSGNPQERLRFIHVAGTNGKGSTCAMLESIYRAAGLRVGLFTSPHLVAFRERIQVNRQLISEDDVARLVADVAKGKMPDATTFFEFITVMALKYFAEQKCDLVIWETGLGGRLDATNIVTPLASLITNIALDHTQWLGDTLEKIAAEKAGIIKPGVPVLTAATEPEVLAVIEKTARTQGTAVTVVGQASRLSRSSPQPRIFPKNPNWTGETPAPLELLHLPGEHQKLNAALALATVEVLQPQIPVGEDKIRAGLQVVDWPGRLQLITRPNGRKILLDGAHNLAGAQALRAALAKDFADGHPVLIFGALADKDWAGICRVLAPLASKIFTVPVASGRTADAGELANVFQEVNPAITVTALESLSNAIAASQDEPFVIITGSLYLIGEALELLGHSPTDRGERGLNEWSATR